MSTWFTYIIYSQSTDKFYTGYSGDLNTRLERHNDGWSKSTKSGIPWKIVYFESFQSKSEAIKREIEIKKKKSRIFIERLIRNAGGRPDID